MDMSVCVLVVLAMVFSGANANFDCRRGAGNDMCKNDGVCTATSPACTSCKTNYYGDDCSYVIMKPCATNNCENGATCHATEGSDACYCALGFMGSTCGVEQYKLVCDYANSQMKITINAACGTIYVGGRKETCTFDSTKEKNIRHVIQEGDDACGDAAFTGDAPNKVYTRMVVLQYDTNTLRPSDEIVIFTCGSAEGVTLTHAQSITVKNYDPTSIHTIIRGVAASSDDVIMTRTPAGANIDFGAPIEFTIAVSTDGIGHGFKDVSIKSCQLQEKVDGPEVQFKVIDEFCPVDAANGIMHKYTGQYITRDGDKQRKFKLTAIKLSTAAAQFDTVIVKCNVVVCLKATDCSVDIETCADSTQQANGRKKRQAGVKEEYLNLNFTITNPRSDKQATRQHLDDKACYQTWEMTVTLAVLGVGLVLVLVVCLVLAVKVILHRKSETTMGKC